MERNISNEVKPATWCEIIREKSFRTPTILVLVLMYAEMFCGIDTVLFYLKTLLLVSKLILKSHQYYEDSISIVFALLQVHCKSVRLSNEGFYRSPSNIAVRLREPSKDSNTIKPPFSEFWAVVRFKNYAFQYFFFRPTLPTMLICDRESFSFASTH